MVDCSVEIAKVYPFLAVTAGSPLFWTAAELYGYADDAVQSLCRDSGLVVAPDEIATYLAANAEVALPANTLRVVEVVEVTNALAARSLPIRTLRDMDALSDTWREDTGTPSAVVLDGAGPGMIRLYPIPDAPGTLELVVIKTLPTVAAGSPQANLPAALSPLLGLSMLGGARAKDGKTQLPEISNVCGQLIQAMTQAAIQYWRPGI